MFRVAIKRSAREANAAVRPLGDGDDQVHAFDSRTAARERVTALSERGGDVRLQAPAPSDPAAVDAYLVADGQCNEWEPIEDDASGVTFPVGGNVYGRLGLALVYLGGTVSPALSRCVADLETGDGPASVADVELEPSVPADAGEQVRWQPDLRFDVTVDGSAADKRYYAEVKTGNGSFQRNQRRDMQGVAETYGVVKIRVDIAELPDRYSVRMTEVHPETWPA